MIEFFLIVVEKDSFVQKFQIVPKKFNHQSLVANVGDQNFFNR
jgi:hypothetical protein